MSQLVKTKKIKGEMLEIKSCMHTLKELDMGFFEMQGLLSTKYRIIWSEARNYILEMELISGITLRREC